MPSKVRIIAGPRNVAFDHYIEDVIAEDRWEQENEYFGIEEQERADYIRRKLKTAGQHMDPPVAVKAFWTECGGCSNGGPSCRYHVKFTVYDMEKAREFKSRVQNNARQNL